MPVDASQPAATASATVPAAMLLDWYDAHARGLPWRTPPRSGAPSDPYRIWLSEVMLQQTTVAAAIPYFTRFTTRWPTVADLAGAEDGDVMAAWAGLGYYARARNLLACARAVAKHHGGIFPDTEAGLRALPGVGRYTAAAVAAIAFGRRAVVVDANVERVVARLFAVETPLPAARELLYDHAATLTPERRAGDYAQAMMDLGATICTTRNPRCLLCPLAAGCAARMGGEPDRYPVKTPRRAKPARRGIAYWLEHDGRVLLVRRPPHGLLGGMRALPGGAWGDAATDAPPVAADWCAVGAVSHVFTHFSLTLDVHVAAVVDAQADARSEGEWWPIDRLDVAGLPTLYARAAALGIAAFAREVPA